MPRRSSMLALLAITSLVFACGLLGVSYATGHIQGDGNLTLPKGVSLSGDIVTAYAGGCAVTGAAAGLTFELRIPFDATRL